MSEPTKEWTKHPLHLQHKDLWQRRGRMFYIRRRRGGKLDQRPLGTSDAVEAVLLYEEQLGKPVSDSNRKITCADAWASFIAWVKEAKAYSTWELYAGCWDVWCADLLGHLPVAKVTPAHIIQVLNRTKTRRSKKTGKLVGVSRRRNVYVALSKFFTTCTEWDGERAPYRSDNPVALIGEKNRPPMPASREIVADEYLTYEDCDKLAAEIATLKTKQWDERVNRIILSTLALVMPEIGGRISEVLGLERADFNPLKGEILITKQRARNATAGDASSWHAVTKMEDSLGAVGAKTRPVPLSEYAIEILNRYLALGLKEGWLLPAGLLFPSTVQTMRSPERTQNLISIAGQSALDRRIVSHFFRHTFASRKLEAGFSLEEIAAMIGDTPETCRKRYAKRQDRTAFNARVRESGRKFTPAAVEIWAAAQ